MAYSRSAHSTRDFPETKTAPKTATKQSQNLFSHMFAALNAARIRQAEREIARYLNAECGGNFTDEAEREIERRFLRNPNR